MSDDAEDFLREYSGYRDGTWRGALGLMRAAARDDTGALAFVAEHLPNPRGTAAVLAVMLGELAGDPVELLAFADSYERECGLQ